VSQTFLEQETLQNCDLQVMCFYRQKYSRKIKQDGHVVDTEHFQTFLGTQGLHHTEDLAETEQNLNYPTENTQDDYPVVESVTKEAPEKSLYKVHQFYTRQSESLFTSISITSKKSIQCKFNHCEQIPI
jgi:hypothetical protein